MTGPKHALAGVASFARFVDAVARVGVSMKGEWDLGDRFRGIAKTARRSLLRVAYVGSHDTASMNLYPLDPESNRLVGHWPNVPLTEFGPGPAFDKVRTDRFLEAAVEEFENVFRAILVENGQMTRREFPTDAALRAWLERAVTENARRGPLAEAAMVRDAFSRAKALTLLSATVSDKAGQTSPEPGYRAFARDATWIAKGRLERLLVNLRAESHVGFLLPNDSNRLNASEVPTSPKL